MRSRSSRVCAASLLLWACSTESGPPPAADSGVQVAPAADAGGACVRPPGCQDLDTAFFKYPACCTAKYACGYELSFEDDFLTVYPQARDYLVQLTLDDPNGKCAPESALFPVRPGTYDHRVELPGEPDDDILVAAQCESRGFSVFTLPGCCMRDGHCGISTDEIAPTFEVLLEGASAPFSPSCAMAPGESSIRLVLSIGPRWSSRTRIVRPLSSEVTST